MMCHNHTIFIVVRVVSPTLIIRPMDVENATGKRVPSYGRMIPA